MRLKRLLILCGLWLASSVALAATDVNHAGVAELDGIKGIGPALSSRILAERAKGRFAGWPDLIARVKGIGPAAAARLSGEGLTVDGAAYPARAEAPGHQHLLPNSAP